MIGNKDTIAAIATAPGVGAIGVIRLSGADAITIADRIFKGTKLTNQASHTLHFGHIVERSNTKEELIDEVVVSLFKAPKSYTGEDVVEISGHGSPFVLNKILDTSLKAGARLATPGEFTQRAFLNGKLDLSQAEAVADLIAADSHAAQQTALKQLRGGFSNDLKLLRDELINFAALVELELDFSEEDVEFADRSALQQLIERIRIKVAQLLQSFQLGNAIKNGVSVAIIGKPNAGKSTLLNALLNEERAIVSDIAGTTRDTIEESLNINGVLFRLIDTAGIRDHTADVLEQQGIERSKHNAAQAHLIIYLVDATAIESQLPEWIQPYTDKTIGVINKVDLQESLPSSMSSFMTLSAKEKLGIDALKEAMYQQVIGSTYQAENTIVTNIRHKEALQKTLDSLHDIANGIAQQISGELIALDIRTCLYHLGTITGQVEVDRDILGTIFGKFCIGK